MKIAEPMPSPLLDVRDLSVTFQHGGRETKAVDRISFSLERGKTLALVGESGSGKSTIGRLISGLYQPWSGAVLFDGRPRDTIDRQVLATSFAVVDQEIFLFEGSVRDNLTLWDESISDDELVAALKDAALYEEISTRPGGLASLISEGGRNLSGGQRQRLEIARAMVGNPTILILDEATSALDPATEAVIDDSLRRRGCTAIIIAHRLSTIRDCDEIVVLQRGKIVQRGTHDDMKDIEGPYADLIRTH